MCSHKQKTGKCGIKLKFNPTTTAKGYPQVSKENFVNIKIFAV